MVRFSVDGAAQTAARKTLRFSVAVSGVLFAGSRNGRVAASDCRSLVSGLGGLGFGFWSGCADGVDACFRSALAASRFRERTFIACAFDSRTQRIRREGLNAHVVAPFGLSASAALRRRTLYLVKRCCMAVVAPVDPATGRWKRDSSLAFRACLEQLKPVFVIADKSPREGDLYRVFPAVLCGVAGFWTVPHPVTDGGPCDEQW